MEQLIPARSEALVTWADIVISGGLMSPYRYLLHCPHDLNVDAGGTSGYAGPDCSCTVFLHTNAALLKLTAGTRPALAPPVAGGGRRRALLGSDAAVQATGPLVLAYVAAADPSQLVAADGAAEGLGVASVAAAPFLHLVLTPDAILWAPCAAVHDLLHATGPHAVPIGRNDGGPRAETIFGRVGILAALYAKVAVRRVRHVTAVLGPVAATLALYKELATAPLDSASLSQRRAANITLGPLVAIDVSAQAQTLVVNGLWAAPKLATLVCAPDVYAYVRDGAGSEASCASAGIDAGACGCAVYVSEAMEPSRRAFGRLYVRGWP